MKTGYRVVNVSNKDITMKAKAKEEISSIPYGMVVWSTGIGTRPVIMDFMEQIGQVCCSELLLFFVYLRRRFSFFSFFPLINHYF